MDESGPGEISRNNNPSRKEGVVGGTRHLTKKGEPLDHSRRVTTASWQSVSSDFSSSQLQIGSTLLTSRNNLAR